MRWDRQPLADFESRPLRALAGHYDLLVVDHPGLGEAVRDGVLRPADEIFSRPELAAWRAGSAGASFDSYRIGRRQWALPLDAAAQVSAARPAEMPARPASWADAVQAAAEVPTVLCLGGPHALLMFSAICVSAGSAPATAGRQFVTPAAGAAALRVMASLLARADPELSQRNPIGVLEAMAGPGGPAYCPLVYGYITYSRRAGPGRRRLAFFDAPAGPGGIGSVLGGTGLAVTRSCAQPAAAAAVIRALLSEPAQTGLFAEHGGQSAARQAWQDARADQASAGFYGSTWATVQRAWVRPRFAGYPAFQLAASAVLRNGLLAGQPHSALVGQVNELFAGAWQSARPSAQPPGARLGLPAHRRTG